jgi:hypothetical protein
MTTSPTYFIPLATIEQFSSTCGVSIRTVEAWVMRGHVPTLKIGRYRLVNVAALVAQTGKEVVAQPLANAQDKTTS